MVEQVELIKTTALYKADVTGNAGIALYADTLPVPTKNTTLGGWVYQKTLSNTDKFNYYIKGYEAIALIIIRNLRNFYMIVTSETVQAGVEIPFLVAYTTPENDGLDAASWYRTKITYTLDTTKHKYFNARKCMLYAGNSNIPPSDFPNLQKIRLSIRTAVGPDGSGENLHFLTSQCDSGVPANFRCTVHNLGWNSNTDSNLIDLV